MLRSLQENWKQKIKSAPTYKDEIEVLLCTNYFILMPHFRKQGKVCHLSSHQLKVLMKKQQIYSNEPEDYLRKGGINLLW